MRTEKEVKEFMEELMNDPSLTTAQLKVMIRTLRWVLGLEDKVIL